MPRKLHMISGAIYETETDGVARIRARSGETGRFDAFGNWIDGDLREADPHLCQWVAGRQLPEGMAANTKDLPMGGKDIAKAEAPDDE